MYQCHIITYLNDREGLLRALDAIPEVLNWRASVGAVFVVTAASVTTIVLAARLRERYPGLWFVVSPIHGLQTQGFADPVTWDFINNPRPKQ